ncbi:hypothetical protein ACIRVF_07835 [Kitasatospora sp. NPDC101157]|uniref:hypothetical protein n=1 Tax=Kitasatospora sp. NPDC101157 TaxID=3364098 RepID=UPI0037F98BAE
MAELSEMEVEELLYAVGLRRGSSKNLAPHGTYNAYLRHLRHQDEPCEPCRKANAEYKRSRQGRATPTPGLRKPIAHGTLAGYQQHRYRKQDACDDCKRAARDYQRARKCGRKDGA